MLKINKVKSIFGKFRKPRNVFSYVINGETKSLTIKESITFRDRCEIVADIAGMIFNDGLYSPYAREFAYGFFLLVYLTDCQLPENSEEVWDVIRATNIVKRVDDILSRDESFVSSVGMDVDDLVDFRMTEYLKNSKADDFYSSLTDVADKIGSFVDSFMGDSDVSAGEILNIAKSIAGKDEETIVKEVLSFKRNNDKID